VEKFLRATGRFYKHPKIILLIGLAVTVFFGWALPKLQFDNSIRSMLPANNPDLQLDNYYEAESRFGKSSFIIVGIKSADAFSVPSLEYLQSLNKDVLKLNRTLPAKGLGKWLGIDKADAQQIVDASLDQGVDSDSFNKSFYPLLTDPAKAQKNFGWDKALAERVAHACQDRDPVKFWEWLETPIRKTQSLVNADYIANEDDSLVSEKLLPEGTKITPEVAQALKAKAESWNIYHNVLYSPDGKLSTLIIQPKTEDADVQLSLVDAVSQVIQKHAQPGITTYLDGEPVISSDMGVTLRSDLALLMPLVVVVVLLVLYLSFKNVQGVLYPMIVVLMGTISALGAMAWLGIPISIASVTLPPLMVAIASAYGIHQMNHYFLDTGADKRAILTHNLGVVGLAVTLSGITVMVGFGALAAEDFVPIRNFGIFTAFGDLIAVAAALWVLPAAILWSKKPKHLDYHEPTKGLVGSLLKGMVRLNQRYSVLSVVVSVLLTAVFAVGVFFVKSELNNVSFFKRSSPIHIADDLLNKELAGTQTINVIFDSNLTPPQAGPDDQLHEAKQTSDPVSVITPAVLDKIDDFSRAVKAKFPYATKVLSFVDILKKMNQEMNGGNAAFYTIPQDPKLIAQYLFIFSGDIHNVVTDNHDKLRISVTLKRVGTDESEAVANFARQYFNPTFQKENHLRLAITGTAHLYYVGNSLLMDGMIKSIEICVVLVFVLLLFVLRSFWMTLIAMIPIAMTLVIDFGFLGLFGIPLNTATAMVSSIAIGIGVDYSIHYVTWYRSELHKKPDVPLALENSILHKGRAILYNMFVIVAGFLVLVVSNFVPLIQFGFLTAICMVTTAFGALIVVPAVLRLLAKKNRKFLYLGADRES
jgi:predicted RND superfamily exporter protein